MTLQITPDDAGFQDIHKKYLASIDTRISGAKISQLAMAAPLESGHSSKSRPPPPPPPPPPVEVRKSQESEEIPNQKLGVLNALLSVGALRPAIALISKYPWIVDASPEIADLMLRILKHSISPLYATHAPTKEWMHSFNKPRARYGSTGVVSAPERKPQLTLWAPTPPCTSTLDFVFFFPRWSERVPTCTTLDDLMSVIEPLMKFIGLHVSRDPGFLSKFLRLGRTHLAATVSPFSLPHTRLI